MVAPFQSPTKAQPIPPMWNMGSAVRLTLSASKAHSGDVSAAAARLPCVVRTPLGTPVVPEVYIWTTVSFEAPRAPGSTASCPASHASYAGPISIVVHGRSSARSICAAVCANAGPLHEHRRAGIRNDRRELRRGQAPVERHEHGTDLADGEEQLDDLGAGPVQVSDAIAWLHARRRQRLRDAAGSLVELAVRQRAVAAAQRHRVGPLGSPVADDVRHAQVGARCQRGHAAFLR